MMESRDRTFDFRLTLDPKGQVARRLVSLNRGNRRNRSRFMGNLLSALEWLDAWDEHLDIVIYGPNGLGVRVSARGIEKVSQGESARNYGGSEKVSQVERISIREKSDQSRNEHEDRSSVVAVQTGEGVVTVKPAESKQIAHDVESHPGIGEQTIRGEPTLELTGQTSLETSQLDITKRSTIDGGNENQGEESSAAAGLPIEVLAWAKDFDSSFT